LSENNGGLKMNELEFIESIDCCFPYNDEKKWKNIISKGVKLNDNCSFAILYEICRVPVSKKINKIKLFNILEYWKTNFKHPIKDEILNIALLMINKTDIEPKIIIELMKNIQKYKGQYCALNILYFAREDITEEIESEYNKIINSWK